MSGPGLGHQGPLTARGDICHQRRATTGPGLLCVHRVLNGKAHPAPEAELPDPDIQPDVEPIGPCPCSYRRQAPLYSGSSLPRRRPIKRHSDFSILNLPFHARHSPVHPNWWTGLCFEDNQSFIAAPRSLCPAPCWQSDVVTISREECLRSRSAKSGGHSNTPLWRGLSANTWARMLPLSLVEASITAPKENTSCSRSLLSQEGRSRVPSRGRPDTRFSPASSRGKLVQISSADRPLPPEAPCRFHFGSGRRSSPSLQTDPETARIPVP